MKEYDSLMRDDWRKETITKLYNNLCQFMKANARINLRTDKPKPKFPYKQLEMCLVKKDGNLVNDIKSFYKMSDKRVIM
jgi:hypothetical protein